MEIRAGDQVITGVEVFSERVWYMGTSRPSMRVRLSGALSEGECVKGALERTMDEQGMDEARRARFLSVARTRSASTTCAPRPVLRKVGFRGMREKSG